MYLLYTKHYKSIIKISNISLPLFLFGFGERENIDELLSITGTAMSDVWGWGKEAGQKQASSPLPPLHPSTLPSYLHRTPIKPLLYSSKNVWLLTLLTLIFVYFWWFTYIYTVYIAIYSSRRNFYLLIRIRERWIKHGERGNYHGKENQKGGKGVKNQSTTIQPTIHLWWFVSQSPALSLCQPKIEELYI